MNFLLSKSCWVTQASLCCIVALLCLGKTQTKVCSSVPLAGILVRKDKAMTLGSRLGLDKCVLRTALVISHSSIKVPQLVAACSECFLLLCETDAASSPPFAWMFTFASGLFTFLYSSIWADESHPPNFALIIHSFGVISKIALLRPNLQDFPSIFKCYFFSFAEQTCYFIFYETLMVSAY